MNTAADFVYDALDASGAKSHGTIAAASRAEAFRQLASRGLTPVSIRPGGGAVAAISGHRGGKRAKLKLRDLAQFTNQFGVLIGAGVPISQGLRGLAEQEPPGAWRSTLESVVAKIEGGARIAKAMGEHPEVFDDLYVATIHAAEESGTLPKVLEYLSELLERDADTRQQVRAALTYPVIVLVVLGLAVAFLVGFIVPKFAKMFQDRGVELPIFTRIVMGVGQSAQTYWYAYLVGIVVLVFGLRNAWRSPNGRAAIDRLLHRIPYLRRLLVGLAVSRFSRVLGLCLNSRLGLIDSLSLAGRASARPSLMNDAAAMAEQVRKGATMPQVLSASTYLPPFAKRLMLSGAETGELTKMCAAVARQHEREVSVLIKNVATVIEPVMIVLIAGVVLVVALAIFMPMWDMVKVMS